MLVADGPSRFGLVGAGGENPVAAQPAAGWRRAVATAKRTGNNMLQSSGVQVEDRGCPVRRRRLNMAVTSRSLAGWRPDKSVAVPARSLVVAGAVAVQSLGGMEAQMVWGGAS